MEKDRTEQFGVRDMIRSFECGLFHVNIIVQKILEFVRDPSEYHFYRFPVNVFFKKMTVLLYY
jgi:hypothetical protein